MSDLLLGFYGDDFTGSTDAMDALSKAGIETVLFLSPPDPEDLAQLDTVQVIGIAGTSRSMTPTEMKGELEPAFAALSTAEVPLLHYKICSTFDSSAEIGSVGKAIDVGRNVFDDSTVPILPGAPPLGRYVIFGNMFAEYDGTVYRLDRHPTMSDHPVTPMSEGNLLRHLSDQTELEMDLVDINQLREHPDEEHEIVAPETDILFFDTLEDSDLAVVGQLLWEWYAAGMETTSDPGFVVGSSGVEYALADYWQSVGLVEGTTDFKPLEPVEKTVIVSGSASPMTKQQIETALDDGFEGIRIDTEKIVYPASARQEQERVVSEATQALEQADSVVIYTALGPDDPAIERTQNVATRTDGAPANITKHIGEVQGKILRTIVTDSDLSRLCIAGGDTCGHVAPQLGIEALTMRYPLAPGSPVCDVIESDTDVAGLQVALKGGQLGGPDYFVKMLRGDG